MTEKQQKADGDISTLEQQMKHLSAKINVIQQQMCAVLPEIPRITERAGVTSQNVRRVEEKIYRLEEAVLHYISYQATTEILALPRNQSVKRLLKYGFKVFSQNDEDGIIEEIFNRIGVTNRIFVEFGVGNGLENNSLFLLHKGWSGLWIEADEAKYQSIIQNVDYYLNEMNQLQVLHSRVTAENINSLISGQGVNGEIDFFHVDIDGNDYHVFKAISCIDPRVVMVEYNAHFPPSLSWVMKYDPDYSWAETTYYGASLAAWNNLLRERYCLVGSNITGNNAFFVRKDIVGDLFETPYSVENHFEPLRYWLHLGLQPYLNFKPKVGPAA